MTSVDELLAALQGVRETLPHDAAEEYRTRMDSAEQQVLAVLRTSRDEAHLRGIVAKAREDGTEQIRNCMTKLDELIAAAGSHW
ncbi:hypothetical protein [Saccharopolyspora phatthalungensis]|uniref:Uncharacterized protein n=1 Tax=Saccharopolyspora phatthalungensis TaxID=664693 RepID=A0A840QBM9_9PSEU|nr:hypothetical protein [Saccharopolyspora phatthalungensis]MBB5155959.1 hypothetical protein [Saccharopolyspora phatthalungensis]